MKSNEKKLICVLLIILVIVAVVFFITRREGSQEDTQQNVESNAVVEEFVQVLDNGVKLNTSTKLNETKTVNGLEIGNIQLTNANGQSVLLADVTNNSGAATELTLLDIILLDKDGNELGKVGGIISPLEVGGKTQLNASTMMDYANAYDFQIVIK